MKPVLHTATGRGSRRGFWRGAKAVLAVAAIALLTGCDHAGPGPRVVAGHLDLSQWDFALQGSVVLEGDWSVCWGQLLAPPETRCANHGWQMTPVSGLWSEADSTSPIGGRGVATYRLDLVLAPEAGPLTLRVGAPMTAYRLFVNGVDKGGAGKVGTSPSTSAPELRNRTLELPEGAQQVRLLVQVANFEFRGGGLRRDWLVGRGEEIQARVSGDLLRDVFLAIIGVVVGLAYLAQFALRPSESARGYFGLAALVLGLRAVPGSVSDLSATLTPWSSFDLNIRLEYLGTALVIFAAAGYFRSKAPGVMPHRLTQLAEIAALVLVPLVTLPSLSVVLATLPLMLVLPPFLLLLVTLSYARAWRRGVPGVAVTLVAALAYAGVVVHDVVRTLTGFGTSLELFPYFLGIWILAEAYELMQAFARSFSTIEDLSKELAESNFELQEMEATVVRFVPFDLLRALGRDSIREIDAGDFVHTRMSVLCCEARPGRSAADADDFQWMNQLFARLESAVVHRGGFVIPQPGSEIMAIFPGGATDAALAAIEMRGEARALDGTQLGIGIATGVLLVGLRGGDQRILPCAMGEPIESARRLCGRAVGTGCALLVSQVGRDELEATLQSRTRKVWTDGTGEPVFELTDEAVADR